MYHKMIEISVRVKNWKNDFIYFFFHDSGVHYLYFTLPGLHSVYYTVPTCSFAYICTYM